MNISAVKTGLAAGLMTPGMWMIQVYPTVPAYVFDPGTRALMINLDDGSLAYSFDRSTLGLDVTALREG